MQLLNTAIVACFMLLVIGQSSADFETAETTSTFETTEESGKWATVTPLKSSDPSMENDVTKESLYLVVSTTLAGHNDSSQDTTPSSAMFDTTNLETGSGGYASETMTEVHEQLKEEFLIITTDSGMALAKHTRTIDSSEVTTTTMETTIPVTSTPQDDQLHVSHTVSPSDVTLIEDNIVSDSKEDSLQTHFKPVSQSQTETSADEHLTMTSDSNLQTMQVTELVEQSTMSDVDHPPTTPPATTKERQTFTNETTEGTTELIEFANTTATSESEPVSDTLSTIGYPSTINRDRSLQQLDDELTTQFSETESPTHVTDVVQEKEDINTTSEMSVIETTEPRAPTTSVTTEPTQVESASTHTTEQTSHPTSAPVTTGQSSHPTSAPVTTGQSSHPTSAFVTTGQSSHPTSAPVTTLESSHPTSAFVTNEQTSHPASVSVRDNTSRSETSVSMDTVSSSTELVTETTKPPFTVVSLINTTTLNVKTSTSVNLNEKTATPTTIEIVSDSTLNTSAVIEDKTTSETNRINCTSSEASSSTTTTTSGENLELAIMKNVKSYDNLSEPEFFNSVTVVFKKPEFETKDSMYFNQDIFKKVVVCLLNVYEAEEWSNRILNVTSCNFKEDNGNTQDFNPLKPNDLVIVYPSPKDNQDEEIVSFFVKNDTAKGGIVSRNRTLAAIGEHQHLLSEQMDMEVVDVYGRIPVALLITPEEKAFHVRHSMLLIILLAVVSSCILAIMTALFCIKYKTQRGRWAREIHDKTQLQLEANKRPDAGDHLNSDEDIRKDETVRIFKNGNGYHGTENGTESTVLNITDNNDAWVVPYNQLTADEKAVPETLDTKL